jgi:hypothetical protein
VLGFTDKAVIDEVLRECEQHRPEGRQMSAKQQPETIPGVKERWRFIEQTIAKAPFFKIVPMIGSLGCPYTCAFCIDSTVDFPAPGLRPDARGSSLPAHQDEAAGGRLA